MSSFLTSTRWMLVFFLWMTVATNGVVAWLPKTIATTSIMNSVDRSTSRMAMSGEAREHDVMRDRRRLLLEFTAGVFSVATSVLPASAADEAPVAIPPVELTPASPDAKKLFNEGRALESQGNMAAAQRLYNKVTKISPRFVYGWSNLGNTQVALGDLVDADNNYSQAIELCKESSADATAQGFGVKKCNDLYILLLNRGTVRLNTPGRKADALKDLRQANTLRERPDAIVLQNLARAEEMNGFFSMADKNYNLAISMTANEVNPFWLRSAMVKLQIGDLKGGRDLLKRVENRFPDAPEVKAASATFLWAMQQQQQQLKQQPAANLITTSTTTIKTSDATPNLETNYQIDAQRKFLEIPDRQRLRFIDPKYLEETIAWPPIMIEGVTSIARIVGDYKSNVAPTQDLSTTSETPTTPE